MSVYVGPLKRVLPNSKSKYAWAAAMRARAVKHGAVQVDEDHKLLLIKEGEGCPTNTTTPGPIGSTLVARGDDDAHQGT